MQGGLRQALAQGLRFLYPENGINAVEVTPADLAWLEPGQFLNDTVIDFYLK